MCAIAIPEAAELALPLVTVRLVFAAAESGALLDTSAVIGPPAATSMNPMPQPAPLPGLFDVALTV
jgi:hypothetical protein